MKNILCLWFLGMTVIFFSPYAVADDDKLSFDKMRSSFDESFDNKTISVPLIVEPAQPQQPQQVQADPFAPTELSTVKAGQEPEESDSVINFMEWALGVVLAIWVVWDASNIGVKKGQVPGFPDFGPIGWFFLTFCCWCIGFPFYISKRKKYIEANQKNSFA